MPLSLPAQQDAPKWRVNISLCPCCSIKTNNGLCQCYSSPPVARLVLFFLLPFHLIGKGFLGAQQLGRNTTHTKTKTRLLNIFHGCLVLLLIITITVIISLGKIKNQEPASLHCTGQRRHKPRQKPPKVLRPQLTCSIPQLVCLRECRICWRVRVM